MGFTEDKLLEEEKDFIEQDFAGKVKTIVRALCPWPEWKVFWEIKMSTYYKLITEKTSRIFDQGIYEEVSQDYFLGHLSSMSKF